MKQVNEIEQKYYEITELYTLSDELLETARSAIKPEAQLDLVEPLIEVICESTDAITEEYITLIEGKPAHKRAAKSKIEGALRKVYGALHEFSQRTADTKNAAHAVVKKIKRQLEVVISNVVEFVGLSLSSIMQKQDVDELKARHANIALMLHQLGQGA